MICGLDTKRLKQAQTFGHRIFRYGMVMRDQHGVEERAGKAGKRQAVSGTTQAGQDGTTRIANEIDDQIEALATYVA